METPLFMDFVAKFDGEGHGHGYLDMRTHARFNTLCDQQLTCQGNKDVFEYTAVIRRLIRAEDGLTVTAAFIKAMIEESLDDAVNAYFATALIDVWENIGLEEPQ